MRTIEVALIEWPNGPENGGPRLIARSPDPVLVAFARERIAAYKRRELERIERDASDRETDDSAPPRNRQN